MHDILHRWARDYAVHPHAIFDLLQRLGIGHDMPMGSHAEGMSESAVQERVRLAASQAGIFNWRNNVGAFQTEDGGFVRYGLCNDTKELNKRIKSADLIGIKPVTVTYDMLGTVIGQFWSREVKEGGWRYMGDAHEAAQLKWQQIILSAGGDAAFTTGAI